MIKTKEFVDDTRYDSHLGKVVGSTVETKINDFLKNDNVRYIDVKYQMSAYGYADNGVNDKGTETSALLIYKDGKQDES